MVKGIHMDSSAKKKNAKLTWHDVGITIGTLAATTLLCYALRPFAGEEKCCGVKRENTCNAIN